LLTVLRRFDSRISFHLCEYCGAVTNIFHWEVSGTWLDEEKSYVALVVELRIPSSSLPEPQAIVAQRPPSHVIHRPLTPLPDLFKAVLTRPLETFTLNMATSLFAETLES
jgi:hypothetical protein